jgi:chromosome segregation ATPase
MIIKKITVENWRTLTDPVTLEFCDGVNVIYGDNGRGKSTVMEALRMGFFDRHNVSGDDIRKIKPWGCELNPRVQIEFRHDKKYYRLTKQFIGQKSCLVERKDALTNEYGRYMESDSADSWLRGLMGGEAAARGLSGPSNWGLAGLLWIPQGVTAYSDPSDALRNRITERKSPSQEQAREDGIEGAIRQEYLKYFTDNGNARTGGGSLKELEIQISQKRTELDKRQRQLSEMTFLRDNISSVQKQIASNDGAQKDVLKRIAETETKYAEYDRLKSEYEKIKARLDVSESQKKLLERDISDVKDARASIDRYKKAISSRAKEQEAAETRKKRVSEQISEKIAQKSDPGSMIKLEFHADTDVVWEPVAGEPTQKRDIGKGEKAEIEGLGKVQARLPSIGTITVTGPISDNAAAMQERVNALKQQLETHIKNIENCKRDIGNSNESIERMNGKISQILADGKTEDGLIEEHRELLGEIYTLNKDVADLKAQVHKMGGNPHRAIDELKKQSEDIRSRQDRKSVV